MTKRRTLGLVLFVMLMLGAVLAASVHAEGEEEVGAKWLDGGTAISEARPATINMELLLTDKALEKNFSILCSMILKGTVGPGAADLITEMQNLDGEKIEGLGGALALLCEAKETCEAGTDTVLWPVGLPWETLLDRMVAKGTYLDHIHVRLQFECLFSKVAFLDTCEGLTSGEMLNVATGVEPMFSAAVGTETLTCSIGGAKSGSIETEESPLMTLEKEQLSVSE
jgi:hypothetical protein